MALYNNKICNICECVYIPTSPRQKYCKNCRLEGRKLKNRALDRKRNRIKNNYNEYIRSCLACGVEFKTYYKKKVYCGSEECDRERIRRKNHAIHIRRDKEALRIKYRNYYYLNKERCQYKKALKYRETNVVDKPYTHKIPRHGIQFVRNYVEQFGYKLLSNKYANNNSKIKLLCPEGHEWVTTFHGFKDAGNRCLHCYTENNYISEPEQKLLDYFAVNHPAIELVHNDRTQISPYELDIYFPNNNLAIEVCGLYWHSEISGGKENKYHYNKMMKCFEKEIRLITVFEDEIRDKFDIVLSRILTALGLVNNKIYARKCEIKELPVGKANLFFENHHLQGHSTAKSAFGLYFNNELVAACSIGSVGRKHAGGAHIVELKRFCSKNNTSVVGGFSKLFKAVVNYCRNNGYKFIKSYCDTRYSNPFTSVYELVGFKKVGYTKYTPHYIKGGKRYRNQGLRKTPEERLTGLTEWDLRRSQGYDRIWDTGHITYIYEVVK